MYYNRYEPDTTLRIKKISFRIDEYIDVDYVTACKLKTNQKFVFGYYPEFTKFANGVLSFIISFRGNIPYNIQFEVELPNRNYDIVKLEDVNIYSTKNPIYDTIDRDLTDVYVEVLEKIERVKNDEKIIDETTNLKLGVYTPLYGISNRIIR